MGKYIITFEDYPKMEEDGVKFYGCNEAPWWYASEQIIGKLTPYTEPDLEQVRQEACQKGLDEAWEAARKIAKLNTDEQKRLFGCFGIYFVAHEFSAHEAIEKIGQYEQEKKEQIQVGDEVITASGKAVVMGVGPVHFEYVYADGSHGFDKVKNVKKTGRHFSEIADVFKKMKGESNDPD